MALLVAVVLLIASAHAPSAVEAAVAPTSSSPSAAAASDLCPTATAARCSCRGDEQIVQSPLDDEGVRSTSSLSNRVVLVFECTRTYETTGQMPNFTTVAEGRVAIREVRLDSLGLRSIGPAAFRALQATTPQSLLLNDNLIEHVDADAFVGVALTLEELDLSHNQLSQLPFLQASTGGGNASDGRTFPNLRKFNLADNRLISLDGASLGRAAPGLIDLNLSENRLMGVEFLVQAALQWLQWLNIGTNRVQRFGRDALLSSPRLHSLMIDDNLLSSIGFLEADSSDDTEPTAPALHPLEILMIQKNRIRSVDGAELARFRRLSILDMSQNELTSVHFLQMAASSGGLTNLKELYISSNRLTTLGRCAFAPLVVLTNLDYQGNPVECGCDALWLRNFSTIVAVAHSRCANNVGYLVNQFPLPAAAAECRSQHDLCPNADVAEMKDTARNREKPPTGLSSAAPIVRAMTTMATAVTCSLVATLAIHTFGSSSCTR